METIANNSLDGFFKAKGMAIIGASSKKGKLGNQIVKFAADMNSSVKIYPINPTADRVLGFKCYKGLEDVPGHVDLAVVALNADEAVEAAKTVARRRDERGDVSAVVFVTGGFSETATDEGRGKQEALLDLLLPRGIRVVGPNCQGIIDTHNGVNTTFDVGNYRKGGLSIITQSGALAVSFLMWGAPGNLLGLNKFVSLGNMSDVNVVDLMKYYAEDERTRVIAIYLEGTRQGRALMETAAAVTKKKPVVVFKSGKTPTGSIAAASHTGSIAGSFEMYQGLFCQAGVILALNVPEFYHTAAAFDKMPLPKGNRVCVLTVVGGPGTICVDELVSSRVVEFARLAEETKAKLRSVLIPAANICKPEGYIDMTGSVSEALHQDVLKIVLGDPNVDGVIYLSTPPAFLDEEVLAENMIAGYRSFPVGERKPLLSVFGYGYTVGKLRRIMEEADLPTLEYADTAAKVMANMIRYSEYRSRFNKA